MNTARAYLLFIILMLAGAIFAQQSSLKTGEVRLMDLPFIANWHKISILGITIAVGLIAIAYMFGQALSLQSVMAFAKHETHELAKTIVILLFVTGALYAFGEFAKNVSTHMYLNQFGGGGPVTVGFCKEAVRQYGISSDPAGLSKHPESLLYAQMDWFLGCMPSFMPSAMWSESGDTYYIYSEKYGTYIAQYGSSIIKEDAGKWDFEGAAGTGASKGVMLGHLINIYTSLFSLEFFLGTVSTLGFSSQATEGLMSGRSFDLAPWSGLTPVSEATIMITDLVGVGIGTILMQKTLLLFFYATALNVFFPLGIAFRGIPFLRKTGSTIIAVALVMYFVYPITLWINFQIYAALNDPRHPAMQDWANYQSLVSMGGKQPGESDQDFRNRIQTTYGAKAPEEPTIWEKIIGFVTSIWDPKAGPSPVAEMEVSGGNVQITLPASTQKSLLKSLNVGFLTVARTFFHIGTPLSGLPADFLFQALAEQLRTSMQYLVLSLVFIVVSIIICITLFRDVSSVLGGEARIFGISKLL